MFNLPVLKAGDTIEIIAPASRCSDAHITTLQHVLHSWHFDCIVSHSLFGPDLLCAHSDDARFESLKNALHNPASQAILCARGGYGSMRLIPELSKISPPAHPKIFIGMSDITALNLFLQQHWQWPVIHGALAPDKFSPESTAALQALLLGQQDHIEFRGSALNLAAQQNLTIESVLTGGNLSLVQASIGTVWQMDGREKIIFLEEIGERGYRIDRMLEHLRQSGMLNNAAAIIFGDCIGGNEPDGTSLILPVLTRFALTCDLPVIHIQGIGHDTVNHPLPLGTSVKLFLGNTITLTCFR